jgi:hypothetical protein
MPLLVLMIRLLTMPIYVLIYLNERENIKLTLHALVISSVNLISANWIKVIPPTIVHIIPVNRPIYRDGKLFKH